MKNIVKTFIAAVFLTSCAAPTYETLRAKARTDNNDTLCLVQIVRPQYAHVAQDELASRGITCDWEKTKMQAQAYIQQNQASQAVGAAQLGIADQMLQNSGRRPYPNTGFNCVTTQNGPFTNTNCR